MRHQRGFSLIELLVVLAIAGLMTGLAVAGLGNGQASVEQALQRLAVEVRSQAALARYPGLRPRYERLVAAHVASRIDPAR